MYRNYEEYMATTLGYRPVSNQNFLNYGTYLPGYNNNMQQSAIAQPQAKPFQNPMVNLGRPPHLQKYPINSQVNNKYIQF